MNRRNATFRALFNALPPTIKDAARDAFRLFVTNPAHPGLRTHALAATGRGRHAPDSISVSVTKKYRAIYSVRNVVNVWYWIGTHADYDTFIGRK